MRMSVCCVLLSVLIVAAPLRSQSVSPRFLVILVVDQMRAENAKECAFVPLRNAPLKISIRP